MPKKQIYENHLKNWQLGQYTIELPVAKEVKTDEERNEFITLLIDKLKNTKNWKQYLMYLAGGASAFYKNPSFSFFYENKDIKNEFLRKIKHDLVPRVSEIEQELFDVFAACIENNLDIKPEFMRALTKCLETAKSYSELYNEYLSYYMRLYYNTLRFSIEEAKHCKKIILHKINEFGEPKTEEEINGFYHIAETFGVETFNTEKTEEETTKKTFLFFKKKETMKVIKKNYLCFKDILEKLKN